MPSEPRRQDARLELEEMEKRTHMRGLERLITAKQNCSRCGREFRCGLTEDTRCWCTDYPPVFRPQPEISCMCPDCLHQEVKLRTEEYAQSITPETALTDRKARGLPKTPLKEGIDYTIENGSYVFTKWYHLRRGACCKSGCRHCPYGFEKAPGDGG